MKYKLLSIILGIFISTQIFAQDSLVAHWTLDNLGDDTTAVDEVGGYDGILTDMEPNWAPGLVDGALDFSAATQNTSQIQIANSPLNTLDSLQSFTISMLVEMDYDATATLLLNGARTNNAANGWDKKHTVIQITKRSLFYRINDGTNQTIINTPVGHLFKENTWGHLVCVRDRAADVMRAYVNGVLVAEIDDITEGSINTAGNLLPLHLGNGEQWFAPLRGKMDDVQILNYAMSAEDIAAMTEGYGDLNIPTLLAHWKLDETTGWRANESIVGASGILMDMTPNWVPGIDGNALDFSAEGNKSTSHIEIKNSPLNTLDSSQSFTISMLVEMDYDATATLLLNGARTNNAANGWDKKHTVIQITKRSLFYRINDGTNQTIINTPVGHLFKENTWGHLVCVRDRAADVMRAYVNGVLVAEIDDITEGSINTAGNLLPLHLGNGEQWFAPLRGKMDDVQILNYAMSTEDIAAITESYGDLNDPKPVAHWKLDETTGWKANESIVGASGILMDMTPNWVPGIDGNALDFSGGESTARVEVKDASVLNMDSTDSFTISMLVTAAQGNRMLLMKGARGVDSANGWNGHHYEVFMIGNDLRFAVDDNVHRPMVNNNVSSYMKPNSWSHFVCVRNRADSTLKTYVNGQLVGDIVDNCEGDISTDGQPLIIGNNEKSSWPFKGKMDDVQILNYAMSGEDIAAMTEGYGDLTDPLLAAHWKLDEETGWRANDAIGIADGLLMDLDPATSWVPGHDGNALDFSQGEATSRVEVKDNVLLNMDSTNSFTISMLLTPTYTGNHMLIMKGARGLDSTKGWYKKHYEIFMINKDLRFRLQDGDKITMNNTNIGAHIVPNSWAHIVCVRDRAAGVTRTYFNGKFIKEVSEGGTGDISTDGLPLIIGNNEVGSWPVRGKMDDVQILNYAMSGEDIAAMTESYGDLTDPLAVAHWKLDETTGWRANDAIGIADGLLMDLDPEVAWVPGFVDNAIDFSQGEATSRVEVKDNALLNMDSTHSFSISLLASFDPTSVEDEDALVIKGAALVDAEKGWEGKWYKLSLRTNAIAWGVDDNINKTQFDSDITGLNTTNVWHHIVAVRDRVEDSLKVYFNGVLVGAKEDITENDISTDGLPFILGNNAQLNNVFDGKLDDVQVLNFAMSAEEVKAMTDEYLIVSVDGKKEQIPTSYSLEQNYPNPFNPSTTIQFGLPRASDVKVIIYNAIGQVVTELVNRQMNAGYHEVHFNASNISSGVYFYRISAGDYMNVKKMLLLK